jgi:hypothetical protein
MIRGVAAVTIIGEATTVMSALGWASHLLLSAGGAILITVDTPIHTTAMVTGILTIATVTHIHITGQLGTRILDTIIIHSIITGLFIEKNPPDRLVPDQPSDFFIVTA